MSKHKDKRFIATDFMKPFYFVWYSAGARLSTLLRLGLVEKNLSERKTRKGKRFTEYRITEKGLLENDQRKCFKNPYKKKCNNISKTD